MGEGLNWADWDGVVKECDMQFKKMDMAKHSMLLAEKVQKQIRSYAKIQRSKYQEPKPQTMEDTEKPADEAEETSEDKAE